MSENVFEIIYPCSWEELAQEERKYRIPIYQRKYAWSEVEVEQLLNDIKNVENKHFIGNIITVKNNDVLDVIDGQQRLTTLYLVMVIQKNVDFTLTLDYEIRENDRKFLEIILEKRDNLAYEEIDKIAKDSKCDLQLVSNLKTIKSWFDRNDEDNTNKDNIDLLKKIKCSLTIIEKNSIDVQKYFEVMNIRGEQLQQHQILKAKLLKAVGNNPQYAKIWEACSKMDCYLEDYFTRSEKKNEKKIGEIRRNLLNFIKAGIDDTNFDDIVSSDDKQADGYATILELLNDEKTAEKNNKSDYALNTYRPIIRFEFFLLHVLRIFANKNFDDKNFDDKKLIVSFDNIFKQDNGYDKNLSENFFKYLLKYRILFDYFIFKRYEEQDKPFLTILTKDNTGNIKLDRLPEKDRDISIDTTYLSILNLQLLFNFTSDFYAQHWIQSVFNWIDKNLKDFPNEDFYVKFASFLESFDNRIMLERLEKKPNLQEIYLDDLKKQNDQNCDNKIINREKPAVLETIEGSSASNTKTIDRKKLNNKLHNGTGTEHYWFYKLEYLLWRDIDWKNFSETYKSTKFKKNKKFNYSLIKTSFHLKRLNSIEHFFPQSKKDQWKDIKLNNSNKCDDCPNENEKRIDCFGNLALISAHMNSSLNDENVNKKHKIQEQLKRGTIESLKMLHFYTMIGNTDDPKSFLEVCKEHQKKMIDCLCGKNQCDEESKS